MKASKTCVIRLMVGLPLVPACVYSLSLPAFIACPGSKVSQDWEYLLEPARVYSLSRFTTVSVSDYPTIMSASVVCLSVRALSEVECGLSPSNMTPVRYYITFMDHPFNESICFSQGGRLLKLIVALGKKKEFGRFCNEVEFHITTISLPYLSCLD